MLQNVLLPEAFRSHWLVMRVVFEHRCLICTLPLYVYGLYSLQEFVDLDLKWIPLFVGMATDKQLDRCYKTFCYQRLLEAIGLL